MKLCKHAYLRVKISGKQDKKMTSVVPEGRSVSVKYILVSECLNEEIQYPLKSDADAHSTVQYIIRGLEKFSDFSGTETKKTGKEGLSTSKLIVIFWNSLTEYLANHKCSAFDWEE